ncbi:tRNA lysidine(34) synthetase TilS [Paratissierella segnis]|jgi:tRNA(Ile)-lysidine synthase|uniref:tRNA(Ile)-lysidine synthase n=1 Tax=Paratissierella segnis TaxID=2763679 RepID=A0A926IJY4_9FIRM|nr:tRNA lysidine(34) synthetase TilS [Paratissierella segnis]MBC8587941.1 tRNA lysidine(34) synthetase TilS [Paratissierella segnis]
MISIVLENIHRYNLITKGDNVVIGLSGGPDSMALLYCLYEIQKELDFNIVAAHVNHGVRGEDALIDQLFTEDVCNRLKIPYHTINVDMNKYGKEKGITAEEAGRELRYGFFRNLLKDLGGGKIAVAHNKNDQAETLLMRIMRGTGIDGLKGMEFKSGDIIRPILNISRDEIEKFIKTNDIETVLDKTNLFPIYSRNKVRLELIPYIEKNFNSNIIEALWRLSQTSSLDVEFLDDYCEKKFKLMVKEIQDDCIIIDGDLFGSEQKGIKQRLLRMFVLKLTGSLQGFTEQHIVLMLDLFTELVTGKQINLPLGLTARVSYDELIIERERSFKYEGFEYKLGMGENYFKDLNLKFKLSLIDNYDGFKMGKDRKYFDFNKIRGNLYIRNRKFGDVFVPLGMVGSKKIKDYFIDKKIPRDKRDRIPLLVDGEDIIWIIGYGISDRYKIDKDTTKILMIEYKYTT